MPIQKTEAEILDLIAKLLAKAESTTKAEAEALTAQAERMMLRHGIERARAEAAKLGRDVKPEEIVTLDMPVPSGAYGNAYATLVNEIALAYGAVRVWVHRRRDGSKSAKIVGYRTDAEAVNTLATSLLLQGRVAMDAWWSVERHYYFNLHPATAGAKRRAYLIGFGMGAAAKLRSLRTRVVAEEEASTAGTEVMLLDRAAAVDAFVDDLGLRTARAAKVDMGPLEDGVRDGRNANVGQTAVTGSRPALTR